MPGLIGRRNRFKISRGFLDTSELAPPHKLLQIEQNHEPSVQFPDSGYIVKLAFGGNFVWRFHLRVPDPEYLGRGMYNQANETSLQFHHDDTVFPMRLRPSHTKLLPQIDD